jgi:hypothetical protein
MYCPKCSAQNEAEQQYCRRCGLSLAIVQLALEGRADAAIAQYKKGRSTLSKSVITLSIFAFAALVNPLLVTNPWASYLMLINLVLGLVIALPMAVTGYVRLSRAERLLSTKDQSRRMIEDQSQQSGPTLSPAPVTDPLRSMPLAPNSVTEHTTLKLKSPEREH